MVVRDEGEGIPADQLEQIFEPCCTTKDSGNGLSLTSSYALVSRHGGTFEVRSEVGVGTEFCIYLEADEAEARPESARTQEESHAVLGHIQVMDDDETVLRLLSSMLKNLKSAVGHVVS